MLHLFVLVVQGLDHTRYLVPGTISGVVPSMFYFFGLVYVFLSGLRLILLFIKRFLWCFFSLVFCFRVEAAWKALRERNVVLKDTEEGYAAVLGDSVRKF